MTDWLIDKSALVRLAASADAAQWAARIERGLIRITTVTRLEVGYSARSGHDLRRGLHEPPLAAMPVEYLTPAIEDRAVEVLALLEARQDGVARPGGRSGHRHRVPARDAVARRQVAAAATTATQPRVAAKTQSVRRSVPVPSPWIRATGQQA